MSELVWFKSSYSGGAGGECVEVAFDWRKSSYSDQSGGECVEVAFDWRKSSHSDQSGGDCVEVAIHPTTVHVRDSKDPEGPALAFSAESWAVFLRGLPEN
ncbi:DUF397 domain-containing protein [Wenjunlia tyrosinilytica]|jgi:hypothetical protein|uniref:DUF397 domain-containing protein n=1 Tax=Wenjunlia tyrosinilytica TaxID=1544741 RepID=A0A917ZU29_9ACTN|nr:DUF397 domain-containing protein [Wenjunlia tyrosinilytica]GGO93004.1 hypothetical protein GCM10012280_44500 [Wenjunlia tyrosinilytica]